MADQEQPATKWGRVSSVVTFLLAFGTLAGIFLYAFAQSANDAYMAHLGLNPSLFGHDRELRTLLGYTLVVKYVLLGFHKLFWPLMVFSVVVATYVALDEAFRRRGENRTFLQWLRGKIKPLISDQATFKQRLFFCVSFGAIAPLLTLAVFICFLSMLSAPVAMGQKAGQEEAREKLQTLAQLDDKPHPSKVAVRKDGQLVMEGYLLAGGENFSAFYNPKTKTVHTLHMDGVELVRALSESKAAPSVTTSTQVP